MSKLNQQEISVLTDMPDHRYVSKVLKDAYCSGGLSEFRRFIETTNVSIKEKYKQLAVLLRGNDNTLIIYKDNHKIWELSAWIKSKDNILCKVSFDFNHARYTVNWEEYYDKLYELGFRIGNRSGAETLETDNRIRITRNKKKKVIGGEIGTMSCTREYFDAQFVKCSYQLIMDLVCDFFKNQEIDYFREAVSGQYEEVKNVVGAGSNVLVEKRWQQRLLLHFQDMKNGYYAYDLEFHQIFPDSKYVKAFAKEHGEEFVNVEAKNIKTKLGTNEPDMLAIRYEKGVPKALVMLEVKSTKTACESKTSGVKKHLIGMCNYANEEIFMRNRRIDAYQSLLQFQEMGIISGDVEIGEIPDDLPVEKVLLLTNARIPDEEKGKSQSSALDYFKQYKDDIKSLSEKYGCSVWTTHSNYWDSEIVIDECPYK